jgi:pyrroline-5-carboxylate reductase
MKKSKIGFIGGGNMAASLIGGLVSDDFTADNIMVAEPTSARRDELAAQFGVRTTGDNAKLTSEVDVVVLAVKPQVLQEVCASIAAAAQKDTPLFLSIAAGIRVADIDRWLGDNCAIVRSMPNTPSLLKSGATALYANPRVDKSQHELAEGILRAVGLTLWVDDEKQLDAVTALSGSGPAYFFLLIEMLQQSGTALGLPEQSARLLALQTAFGAAKMALESSDDPAELRRRVTSPGGTTERAIDILEQGGIRELFEQALSEARDRAVELADQLGGNN